MIDNHSDVLYTMPMLKPFSTRYMLMAMAMMMARFVEPLSVGASRLG
ncbi:MAG TPA: hypothetical protein VFF78_03930 [Anaerolineaceae bacterium]|nr:hypothetical protein [Anaerolineaceae bacterium]